MKPRSHVGAALPETRSPMREKKSKKKKMSTE